MQITHKIQQSNMYTLLKHWSQFMHTYITEVGIIGLNNVLPIRRQAIT